MNNNMVPGHADAAGAGGTLSGCQVRAVTRAVTCECLPVKCSG